ncbi:S49 family peptidase [Neisseria sp. CP9]|nr:MULTISPECIES: S49 family peptidase [Neisseria]MBF1290589.1 S49 family peptidase [Neisseria sicca]OFL98874.1 protease [Neisseria sp. HMSC074B07]OFO28452.1 protease [Neisseria sp. HMSC065D04]OHR77253.1 protease [Neisseria sp. HMSC70E02]UNV86183.1 S49 family peptidase [Neisseria macacae ATCC 33926]
MQEPYSREGNNPSSHSGSFWEREVLREVLLASYKEQRSARIWRNIWRVIGVILFLMFIASLFGDDTDAVQSSGEHTAVIDLKGEIGNELDDQVEMLRTGMEAVYNNPNAKAIIIRANSPGGSPVVSNIAFNEIRRMKSEHKDIPVYVVAEDMCASGCYYIAAAADKIYADPSSVVGSIGVIGGGFDATGLMDKIGIKRRLKIAGSNKGMGDPFSPETPAQTQIWEKMLTDIHKEFIKSVKLGRGKRLKDQQYSDVFSGRIYTGSEAKEVGLIDDFGSVYSVARDVVKAPELVNYTPEEDFGKILGRHLSAEMETKVKEKLSKIW